MDDVAKEIASQLRGIKHVLIVAVSLFSIMAVSDIYYMVDDTRENRERRLGITFTQQADSLWREREWSQLLALAQDRQRKHSRAADGFFWAGVAHLELDQFDQAEEAFKHALDREPRMKDTVQNWMKSLGEKREALQKQ